MPRSRWFVSAVCLLSGILPAEAGVQLHPLFTDNRVLQQGMPVPVWGTADPGEKVTVRIRTRRRPPKPAWTANRSSACLPLQAGGLYELAVTGKSIAPLKNVPLGEVWLASDQSNMEWPLRRTDDFPYRTQAGIRPAPDTACACRAKRPSRCSRPVRYNPIPFGKNGRQLPPPLVAARRGLGYG